jgi:hypothetical protein
MSSYDIVYIKGNPSSGTLFQHEQMNSSVLELIKDYTYTIIDSEDKNLSGKKIPEAKVYIGFSRGSRYLKKLPSTPLKISIGGIKGSKVHLFKNDGDHILLGDISISSLESHFIISKEDKIKIKELIADFLV